MRFFNFQQASWWGRPGMALIFAALIFSAFIFSGPLQAQWPGNNNNKPKVFGTEGQRGEDGLAGAHGRPALDVSIYADGTTQAYHLNGGDGGPGLDGASATPATECKVKEDDLPDNDLQGANGGRGGDGGQGGRGADGANATIFIDGEVASERENLGKIFVSSVPGRGGFGGRAGQGSEACLCPQTKWKKWKARDTSVNEPVCRYYNVVSKGPHRPPSDGKQPPVVLKTQSAQSPITEEQVVQNASNTGGVVDAAQGADLMQGTDLASGAEPMQIGGGVPEDPDCLKMNLSIGLCVLHKLRPNERCYRWNREGHCIGWRGSKDVHLPKEAVCQETDASNRKCVAWTVTKNGQRCVEGGSGTCIDFEKALHTTAKGQCTYEQVNYKVREEKEYKCQSGQRGLPGAHGLHGENGRMGSLYIVTHGQKIKPDILKDELHLSPHSLAQQTLELGLNQWKKTAGAVALLSPGSQVDETYKVYEGRTQVDLSFRADNQSSWPDRVYEQPVRFSLHPAQRVEAHFIKSLWVNYSVQPVVGGVADQQVVHIKNVLTQSQVEDIEPIELRGVDAGAELHIKDPLLHLDFVRTRVHLKTRWSLLGQRGFYDDFVSDEFIKRQGRNTLVVQIGRLPVKLKHFKKGRAGWFLRRVTSLTLNIERSAPHSRRTMVGSFKVSKALGVAGPTKIERIDKIDIEPKK